jgi:hypothetical protein
VLAAAIAWRAWTQGMPVLAVAVLTAYLVPFLHHRYSLDRRRRKYSSTLLFFIVGINCGIAVVYYLPHHPVIFLFFATFLLLIALNNSFYLFLAAKRGRFFGIAAIPFHLLYHFYNGISFGVGLLRHSCSRFTAADSPRNP